LQNHCAALQAARRATLAPCFASRRCILPLPLIVLGDLSNKRVEEQYAAATMADLAETRVLSPLITTAISSSVYDAAKSLGVDEREFQVRAARLRSQEYKYYADANKDRMPVLPNSDQGGGWSNPAFFNFAMYCTWKTAFDLVGPGEQRTELINRAGALLVEKLTPGALSALAATRGTPRAIIAAVERFLRVLQEENYVLSQTVIWGETPSPGNPQEDSKIGVPLPLTALPETNKLTNDSAGAAVPRAGGRAAALMGALSENLRRSDADDLIDFSPGSVFQVRLLRPADIEGSVSLRAEENGDFGFITTAAIGALLEAGLPEDLRAIPNAYLFQDAWQPPKSAVDRILLLLGDPLFMVEVPWEPTSMIEDWIITS